MAPTKRDRALKALMAMKALGVSGKVSKPILKNLLKVYDENWEYIEEDNYRVFADAIFDGQESQPLQIRDSPNREKEIIESTQYESDDNDEHGPHRTKNKMKREDEGPSSSTPNPSAPPVKLLKTPRSEAEAPDLRRRQPEMGPTGPVIPQPSSTQKRAKVVVSPRPSFIKKLPDTGPSQDSQHLDRDDDSSLTTFRRRKQTVSHSSGGVTHLKGPEAQPNVELPRENRLEGDLDGSESPQFEVPLAMIPPSPVKAGGQAYRDNSSKKINATPQENVTGPSEGQRALRENGERSSKAVVGNNVSTHELAHAHKPSATNMDIASTSLGEVKLLLTSSSANPNFQMPNLEDLLKMAEDRCLRSYKILQPDFSLVNLMKELCQCALELGSESNVDKQERFANVTPSLDALRKPTSTHMFGPSSDQVIPQHSGSTITVHGNNENGNHAKKNDSSGVGTATDANLGGLVVVPQPQVALYNIRPLHDTDDISKGEERVRIPIANDFSSEKYPSSFNYIQQNIVYQSAYVNVSLARIGDEDCCSDCFGDCLAAAIPCACAREAGGEFAYTRDGLLRREFLDGCMSMNRDPQEHHHYYCKSCPLERPKNETEPNPCKGHLIRKFIKECWSKCGCNKQCGNRVVQRGITCNLQVFLTGEGKGWGVRTLDELPRGAFVCEYVGEILTNMELYNRTMQRTGNSKHTYPVLLDADWGSEGVLKDEEALCLDATFYGNVARFINHRCFDAALVEIPIEVETPDRHYYHLAFFTTRKVEAFEELTWDYGIDFGDLDHPIKAFRCHCGSKYCRDKKRASRTSLRRRAAIKN